MKAHSHDGGRSWHVHGPGEPWQLNHPATHEGLEVTDCPDHPETWERECWYCEDPVHPWEAVTVNIRKLAGSFDTTAHHACAEAKA